MSLLVRHQSVGDQIERFTLLRGLGAIAIVAGHYMVHFEVAEPLRALFAYWLERGAFLVDFFFVISGFVLYYVYKPQFEAKTLTSGAYIWRRLARIYPVHLFTLILAALIYGVGGWFGLGGETANQMKAIWSNLFMLHAYGLEWDMWLNYPSWSVSAEFFAYLFVPGLIALLWRVPQKWALPLSLLFFAFYTMLGQWIISQWYDPAPSLFVLTFNFGIARIVPSFVLGLGIARAVIGWQIPHLVIGPVLVWAMSALVLVAMFVAPVPVVIALFGLTLAVYYLVPRRAPIPQIFIYLGTISYSIYMIHAIVEIAGFKLVEILFGFGRGEVPIWSLPIFVTLGVLAAIPVFHFVEVPGRRLMLAMRLPRRQQAQQPAE